MVLPKRFPLKVPFITALGRKDATENVLVRVRLRGGAEGWGEASGSVVMADHRPRRLSACLKRLGEAFRGADCRRLLPLSRDIWTRAGRTPAAAAAFECAVTDALLQALDVPMPAWFGGASRRVETDITLSAASPADTAAAAARAAGEGFRILKVKVGSGGHRTDLARVRAADQKGRRGAKRPKILLDGNQGLSSAGALRLVGSCLKCGIRVVLLEQPLPADRLEEMAQLQQRCPVPLAADESVRSPADAVRVARTGAAKIINVKVAKTGLQGSLEVIAAARAAGLGLMIGCMQETALGLSAGVALACGTGAFQHLDLDSDHLLVPEGQPEGIFTRKGPFLHLR